MKKVLLCVDCQNDFITGSLANKDADAKVPAIAEFAKNFDGKIILTFDTHFDDYFATQEGHNLSIQHCIISTPGHMLDSRLSDALTGKDNVQTLNKFSFGFPSWNTIFNDPYDLPEEIHVCGFVTDICVISNVLILKATLPETKIIVHANLCAGLTPEKHEAALEVMRSCQVEVAD